MAAINANEATSLPFATKAEEFASVMMTMSKAISNEVTLIALVSGALQGSAAPLVRSATEGPARDKKL